MFKDNKDFYPTPKELFYQLMSGKRHLDGHILEPSAGKGDLVNYIKGMMGRHEQYPIDVIEIDPHLQSMLIGEGYNVVWDDFLTYETYKEYSYIIMNPPFSNGDEHLLKAINLAENQLSHCEIYAILNKETINNAYSSKRQELLRKLNVHKAKIKYVIGAFKNAERRTNVEVALIHIEVEKVGQGRNIYDSIPFFASDSEETKETLETTLTTFMEANEITEKLNEIERLVIEYETAADLIRESYESYLAKSSFLSYISQVNKRKNEGIGNSFNYVVNKQFYPDDYNEELRRLRREYWRLILDTDEFAKLLTNEARQKLNKQLSLANEMELNLPNIKTLLMAIKENQNDILIDSIVSIFEKITRFHMNEYSSNIHYYNGWKTNNAYRINKKIIIPIKYSPFESWDFSDEYEQINSDVKRFIDDLVKVFKLIDSTINYEFTSVDSKQEFENELLRFKMFKNGNIHIWFKRLDLLKKLNYICGQHFNWIPSEDEQKSNKKAREFVAKKFGDMGDVKIQLIAV